MKKSQLRNIIREVIKENNSQLLNEQNVQGAAITAVICDPQPNECNQPRIESDYITICAGPGWTNCVTPQVGDYFTSQAVNSACNSGQGMGTTSWEVVSIQGYGPEDGKRLGYHQCNYIGNVPTSFNCSGPPNYTCSDPGNGLGTYTTQNQCQTNCNPSIPPSFNCKCCDKFGNGNCTDPGDGSGQYSDLATCKAECEMERIDNILSLSPDDNFGNPYNPNPQDSCTGPCNATMVYNSGTIEIRFYGECPYEYNLRGPQGGGIINTLVSQNQTMSNQINYITTNLGTYTLDYGCADGMMGTVTLTI
tara:strand:+ start:450 stop:1367 length:918 start_codon:yes stop_codon:yes gene_type:complete